MPALVKNLTHDAIESVLLWLKTHSRKKKNCTHERKTANHHHSRMSGLRDFRQAILKKTLLTGARGWHFRIEMPCLMRELTGVGYFTAVAMKYDGK